MTIRFFPGEMVKIKTPQITGRVIEIKIFDGGAIEYVVRWWVNGDTRTGNFVESEIEQTSPHEEIKIGFQKNEKSC